MGSRLYSDYFGIRENAFSITPDPRYLYMSERHREALAHLLYGAVECGGFVQLTGEVGTGKTTICRAFLDQLPDEVDVALLLSPPQTPRELLLAIITELRIPLRTPTVPLKALVDRLNATLLESHAGGRRTVVLIDEAQNIHPDVLEQVRLLTNLETRTAKLLQVFLIGQPELREQLERPELRQVAQRITARYHLEPLGRRETEDYIRHRLTVAGCRQGLFSAGAMKQVFQESQGIPRVINILCDRALLGAFACDKAQVDAATVRYAARQWRGARGGRALRSVHWSATGMVAGVLLLLAAVVYAYSGDFAVASAPFTAAPAPPPATPAPVAPPTEAPSVEALPMDAAAPAAPAPAPAPMNRREAAQALLQQWQIGAELGAGEPLCTAAREHGLRCRREIGSLATLQRYNRPALLTLLSPQGEVGYGTLLALDATQATLLLGAQQVEWSIAELLARWNGEFELLWRPPLENTFVIGAGAPAAAVLWLRQALDRVDGTRSPDRDRRYFDHALQARLRAFQTRRGLVSDGVAGMQTLTILLNTLGEARGPLLAAAPPQL